MNANETGSIKFHCTLTNLIEQKILVKAGHEEGVISFGADLTEAGELIFRYF